MCYVIIYTKQAPNPISRKYNYYPTKRLFTGNRKRDMSKHLNILPHRIGNDTYHCNVQKLERKSTRKD